MENLFDCLCSLMLEVTNRERFLKGEGLQLMNLMLRFRFLMCLLLKHQNTQGEEEVKIGCIEGSLSRSHRSRRH